MPFHNSLIESKFVSKAFIQIQLHTGDISNHDMSTQSSKYLSKSPRASSNLKDVITF